MREIKFRAWYVTEKEMISADLLAFEEYEPLMFQLRDSDYMKFMQFTGLLDKNGKEIYEGDVVRVDGAPNLLKQAPVEYGRAGFILRLNGPGKEAWGVGGLCELDMEVIGNIYENPDLLETP